jgi:hypothetical protein
MRTKTMLAGILITLGVGAFAYQGIASTNGTTVGEVRTRSATNPPAHDVPPLPVLGAVLLFGGIGLLIVERTRSFPHLDRKARSG